MVINELRQALFDWSIFIAGLENEVTVLSALKNALKETIKETKEKVKKVKGRRSEKKGEWKMGTAF